LGELLSPDHCSEPPPPPPDFGVKVATAAAQYTLGVVAVNVSEAGPAFNLYAARTPTSALETAELRCVVAVYPVAVLVIAALDE
jgi:hypothetical protein